MRITAVVAILFVLFDMQVWADERVMLFYVMKTQDVTLLKTADGKISQQKLEEVKSRAICNGSIKGTRCHLYLRTKDYQIQVETFIGAETNGEK